MPAISRSLIVFLLFAGLGAAQGDALLSGLEAFHRGNYASAERDFREALKQGADPRARTFLALTLAATGRCGDAERDLAGAFGTGAEEVRRLAGLALAQCHITRDRLEDAAAVVSQLKARYPADADVLYQAARLHMRAWNETIYQLYQKAPASFRVNQISGEILETQGNFPEANDNVELYFFQNCYVGISAIENGATNVCGPSRRRICRRQGRSVQTRSTSGCAVIYAGSAILPLESRDCHSQIAMTFSLE
jgi:tetratricopeptide (TPR) repeat protein